jgi:hypothetical protein
MSFKKVTEATNLLLTQAGYVCMEEMNSLVQRKWWIVETWIRLELRQGFFPIVLVKKKKLAPAPGQKGPYIGIAYGVSEQSPK